MRGVHLHRTGVTGGPPGAITITTLADTLDDAFATYNPSTNQCGTVEDSTAFPDKPTLREALIYANSTPGAETITFARRLSGQTLTLDGDGDTGTDPDPLPRLCGANTTLDGDVNGDGTPDITLDGTGSSDFTDGLFITASNITVNGFRLTNMSNIGIRVRGLGSVRTTQITNNTITGGRYGILVQAGLGTIAGTISDTTIRGNTVTGTTRGGILLSTVAARSTLTNTTVEQNEVYENTGHGISAWSEAVNTALVNSLTGLTIQDNHIHDQTTGSGIAVTGGFCGGSYNRVQATIADNTLSKNGQANTFPAIAVTGGSNAGTVCIESPLPPTEGNRLDITLTHNLSEDIPDIGLAVTGGTTNADNNEVRATLTGNTVWRSVVAGLALTGGRTNADSNTVTATLQDNLVVGSFGHGLALRAAAAVPAGSTSSDNTLTVSGQNNLIVLTRFPLTDTTPDILRRQNNVDPTRTDNRLTDRLTGTIFASRETDPTILPANLTDTATERLLNTPGTLVRLPTDPPDPVEVDGFIITVVPASAVPSGELPSNTQFSTGRQVFDIDVHLVGVAVTAPLTVPVRVCLPRPVDVPASRAYVLRYDAATASWERLDTGRTLPSGQVCAQVKRFSYFTVGNYYRRSTGGGGGGGGGGEPAILHSTFESPAAGATVSGIAVLRGWSFADLAGVGIAEITLSIDGSAAATIPCCSERPDVAAAFPALPAANTQTSGWGMIYNWGNLAAGPHTLQVVVTSTDGGRWTSDTRSVTVLKPGDMPFADRFRLADAEVRLAEGQVVLDGAVIRDKATQAEQTIEARYAWQTAAQGLRLVATTPLARASAGPLGARVSRLLAGLTAWGRHWLSPAGVHANEGVTAAYEAPTDMSVGAGVGVLRGWAFATDGSAIEAVRLSIDDADQGSLPCCSERADVAAEYPDDAAARLSGWGGVFNYGNLAGGEHTIAVEIGTAAGGTYRQAHTVTTVQLGGFAFVDQFELGQAEVTLAGEELVLSGVVVRDAASQQTQTVRVWLRWSPATQGLVIVDSEIMP